MEQKIILTNVETAFYKAGEAIGMARAMEKSVQDLRAAAVFYANIPGIAEKFETFAKQVEVEAKKQQQIYAQLVEQAISTRRETISIAERLQKAATGAWKGWRKC